MRKTSGILKPEEYVAGILKEDRIILSRAITLIESKNSAHRKIATEVLERLTSKNETSFRIGITGVPGVGKSTFIDAFGTFLTGIGKRVAVLSIDPSSAITRGSILGDKTRMSRLAKNENAFVRPSPAGAQLGGVTLTTREAIKVCESAGFDVIIVETVGVGQSETAVKDMTDFFLLLMLAGGGDELQGIKRGIMEMADMLVVNKADGDNRAASLRAVKAYKQALHLFPAKANQWSVPILSASSTEGSGMESIWESVLQFEALTTKNGCLSENRKSQDLLWFREALRHGLEEQFFSNSSANADWTKMEKKIAEGKISVRKAIDDLLRSK